MVRSQFQGRKVPGSKPNSNKDPRCTERKASAGNIRSREPSRWRYGSLVRGPPAQLPSSSSDHGSECRSPSQNSPRLASKRGTSLTKLS
ncbi:hypothetical protein AVEN_79806-1 [Araneus ventricosus]|uniref:Uncharacterized protein n=1 Tax=Araneus ventricosus TaxID=182803 RepID=A0A4Y2J9P6_ARAVE|nr:hypothetical protein AVEN_79806-1 [Araneus ventricosus]